MLLAQNETETKNVPYFIQQKQREAQEEKFYDNFTADEHKLANEMRALVEAAYIAKEYYQNVRKTKLVIKAERVDYVTPQHQAMRDFADLHGFEQKYLKSSNSISYSLKH